ncbi:MAG: aldo/keto reductase [Acidobacteriaceae bacterium]|nr:aldo/keto reductase [Acidobacteriaceae bacterium]
MQKRTLGDSGLEVSPLCLGGNVFGWTADENTSFRVLDAFVDGGFNFIDTADVYSKWVPGHTGGESETILGKWFRRTAKREKVILATKVGLDMGDGKKGLSRKYILQAVDDSLSRLGTDYIDLYQSHTDDPQTPLEETLDTFAELIKRGKVRAIGASNYSAERLAESLKISDASRLPRYESLQPLYNLYDRAAYEGDLEHVCQANHIGVIPYYALASGFLTGKYRSEEDVKSRPRAQRLKEYFDDRGRRILAALEEVASQYNSAPAQISLAWLMARPSITAPIASATSTQQLQDLLDAANLQLDQPAIDRLNQAGDPARSAHAR